MDDILLSEMWPLLHACAELTSQLEESERRGRRKNRSTEEQLPESRGLSDNVIEDEIPRPNEVSAETRCTSSARTLTAASGGGLEALRAFSRAQMKCLQDLRERGEQKLQRVQSNRRKLKSSIQDASQNAGNAQLGGIANGQDSCITFNRAVSGALETSSERG